MASTKHCRGLNQALPASRSSVVTASTKRSASSSHGKCPAPASTTVLASGNSSAYRVMTPGGPATSYSPAMTRTGEEKPANTARVSAGVKAPSLANTPAASSLRWLVSAARNARAVSSHRPYQNGATASQLSAVPLPSAIAVRAAWAEANQGSPVRRRAVFRRSSAGTSRPTAKGLGVISVSAPTRSGWCVAYSAPRFAPAEWVRIRILSRPSSHRSASTSATWWSQRYVAGSSGTCDCPVPRRSRRITVRWAVRPPRSPRYAESCIGPPGRHTTGGPSPSTW